MQLRWCVSKRGWLTLKISGGWKLKMEIRHLLSRPLDLDVRTSI
jgi:hypothetical protein